MDQAEHIQQPELQIQAVVPVVKVVQIQILPVVVV
jgi:hypothetical protein